MRCWPSHQYVLGDISLTRSEQTLSLQSSQRFKACPTDPNDTIFGLHFPTPATDSQIQADPSLKEKAVASDLDAARFPCEFAATETADTLYW